MIVKFKKEKLQEFTFEQIAVGATFIWVINDPVWMKIIVCGCSYAVRIDTGYVAHGSSFEGAHATLVKCEVEVTKK